MMTSRNRWIAVPAITLAVLGFLFLVWLPMSLQIVAELTGALAGRSSPAFLVALALGLSVPAVVLWSLPPKRGLFTLKLLSAFAWVWLVFPVFGIAPLLVASGLAYRYPPNSEFAIWLGFTLTNIYNVLNPSSQIGGVDHPFPPIAPSTLLGLSVTVCVATALSVHSGLRELRRRRLGAV